MIKCVWLVDVPSDINNHGVGVAPKAEAVLQQEKRTRKNNKAAFHMNEGRGSWLIIPKSDYIDALAADTGERWQPGNGKKSFRLGPRSSTRSRRSLPMSIYI